jgi:hypothetical protein
VATKALKARSPARTLTPPAVASPGGQLPGFLAALPLIQQEVTRMLDVKVDAEKQVADLNVGEGCPLCGGALSVRTTPGTVWSYCAHCRRLSQPKMAMGHQGLLLFHPAAVA